MVINNAELCDKNESFSIVFFCIAMNDLAQSYKKILVFRIRIFFLEIRIRAKIFLRIRIRNTGIMVAGYYLPKA